MPRIAVGVTDPEPEDKACTSLVNSCIPSALGGTLAQVYE